MDAAAVPPTPRNEPILQYGRGAPERDRLVAELARLGGSGPIDLPAVIDGEAVLGPGEPFNVVEPHAHANTLGVGRQTTGEQAQAAARAALAAAPAWGAMDYEDRAAIFLRAADLISGPRRELLNAATMLGQSKTAIQAEIDSACELIDFLRFNAHFGRQVLAEQPQSSAGVWNRMDHRPLEGFVYAVTPFNFTAIAGNLPTAPALMGNVVVWKPSSTQQLAAHFFMQILIEAGLPPGVINMLPGGGVPVSEVLLPHPNLAGVHFTGSTALFRSFWREIGRNLDGYRTYPRLVGETGGKDFVLAHPSADPGALRTALVRGAFEYQGQKCSAASRAYIPRSLWRLMGEEFLGEVDALRVGPVTDLANFAGAVIDAKAYARLASAISTAQADDGVDVAAGGQFSDETGWFVRPTVLVCSDPRSDWFSTEFFGPLLSVFVYEDDDFDATVELVDTTSDYGLTGAIMATDRAVIARVTDQLRFAAGNFYVNDKPTGAVVGQQPFGGARASGTDDKAGSVLNLQRWVAPRSIKETFVPPSTSGYPHME